MVPREQHPTDQLLDLLEDGLSEEAAERVRSHVERCARCTQEVAALEVLLTPIDEPGLTEIERARLRRNVMKEIPTAVETGEATWMRRLAPYLGTAAVLALLAVGVMTFDMTGDRGGRTGGVTTQSLEGTGDGAGGTDDAVPGLEDAAGNESRNSKEAAPEAAPQSGAILSSRPFPEPRPTFVDFAGEMVAEDLDELGRFTAPLPAFARSYRVDDVAALGEASLAELSKGLPPREARMVRRCGREVLEAGGYSAIAAYGAHGSMDGRDVLLLGFAWTPHPSGALDRFMVWAWPRGSCEAAFEYRMGFIDG